MSHLETKNEEAPIRLSIIALMSLLSASSFASWLIAAAFGVTRRRAVELKFKPKYDKIVELLLHLAYLRPNADKYQAVKFFYLADKAHLERFGRPISFETYYALPYGPVASNVMDLLERDPITLKKAKIKELPFRVEDAFDPKAPKKSITFIREPFREVDRDLFSRSDLRVFEEIVTEYGGLDFDDLYKITHSHAAYNNAWSKRGLSRRALMDYADMIEDADRRASLVEDLEPVAAHMR